MNFIENIIDDCIPMQPLSPELFDRMMAEGWRILGSSIIRHNFSQYRGALCHTIPLRINLTGFTFSRSRRKLLARNAERLRGRCGAIRITPEKEALFLLHTARFKESVPERLGSFITPYSAALPTPGYEIELFDGDRLIACSYFHVGKDSVSATYCFFDPEYAAYSLGSYTMLLEIRIALQLGKSWYYHGYCYDIPSQFDYKRNFEQLEAMDWESGLWKPHPRFVPG